MHLVIGTPMYGGMCTSEYTQSLLNLSEAANKSNVKLTTIFLGAHVATATDQIRFGNITQLFDLGEQFGACKHVR